MTARKATPSKKSGTHASAPRSQRLGAGSQRFAGLRRPRRLVLLLLEASSDPLAEGHELLDAPLHAGLFGGVKRLRPEARDALAEAALHQIVVDAHALLHLELAELREDLVLVAL